MSPMRFLIVITSLLLIPVLVIAHLWIYDEDVKPGLAARALGELKKLGVKHANVRLDYLDASISGVAKDVETREKAAEAMRRLGGIHFIEKNNLIVVPSSLEARLDGTHLALSGWLPDEKNVREVRRIVAAFRPDLQIDAKKLRISPFVVVGADPAATLDERHRLMRPILASLREPASFAIQKSGATYIVTGALPTGTRQAVLEALTEALKENTGGWTIDAAKLAGGPHISEAAFTKGNGLPLFLRSFFSAPTPGTFFIDENGGPHIEAHATKQMESEWLAALRGVSGAAKVDAKLTLHPSIYQLPGYRPASEVDPETLAPAMEALKQTALHFDPATNLLAEDEETKLAALAELLVACGPALHLILSGADGAAAPENKTVHHARAEQVKAKLSALGLTASQMEVLDIGGLWAPPPPESDPVKQMSARVEIMIK